MAQTGSKITLSKSQLSREKESLATYRRYLPALDLKRQQLMAERNRARTLHARLQDELRQAVESAGANLPMLADKRVSLDALVTLESVDMGAQNVAGVRLPRVNALHIKVAPYGPMTRPHWVDSVVRRLTQAVRLKVECAVAERRLALLDQAVTRVTQRTNLFEKILIPQAEQNIRRILVFIGDTERAAVVSAKLAKAKRAGAGAPHPRQDARRPAPSFPQPEAGA
ncbi:V-type ATP synthase subunit D [Xanthobacter sp. TB0136]|uniref:V-type ATP synthase subunit D n=1 Tax=Xanthobacter sp. TB0136 TaxID=3459177 RepID=UPI00403A2A2B